MLKSILATVGIVAVVGGIAVWQIGFFSDQALDVKKQVERATASAKIDKVVSDLRSSIASLDEKARHYNIEARKLELVWEREKKTVDQLKEAIDKLSAAAKEAGLPKPSSVLDLTDEQRAVTLTFNGKTVGATEIYKLLADWFDQYKVKADSLEMRKQTIDRLRESSEQIKSKKGEMTAELAKLESRVKELESAKDLAKINAELAEMEASVNGVDAGDSGKAMRVVQEQIDELNAIAETYQQEAQTKATGLNPIDVIQPSAHSNELDALWE